ncbi:hypothetical protein QQF64_003864 [Cirrhinus molitorella]|uniref:Uncharacterized protein n=1 Tax=Cirrhinus molitorella TaxID=172907 RepID=A0ABR3MMI9_9TELE
MSQTGSKQRIVFVYSSEISSDLGFQLLGSHVALDLWPPVSPLEGTLQSAHSLSVFPADPSFATKRAGDRLSEMFLLIPISSIITSFHVSGSVSRCVGEVVITPGSRALTSPASCSFLNKERATESIGRARTSLWRIRLQRQTCPTAALFVLVWQLVGRWRASGERCSKGEPASAL